jgi:hypothetical protein
MADFARRQARGDNIINALVLAAARAKPRRKPNAPSGTFDNMACIDTQRAAHFVAMRPP